MTNQLFSIFDNKKKFFLVSEDELKKFHQYAFDRSGGFDYSDAKKLFQDISDAKKLFQDIFSRQAQNDIRSWQLVCKYCPLNLRCEVLIEDTSKCQIFNKLSVRNYSVHALDELQFQRQRLFEIFGDLKKAGICDNHCDICILCDNTGACIAEKALRLLRESHLNDQSGIICPA